MTVIYSYTISTAISFIIYRWPSYFWQIQVGEYSSALSTSPFGAPDGWPWKNRPYAVRTLRRGTVFPHICCITMIVYILFFIIIWYSLIFHDFCKTIWNHILSRFKSLTLVLNGRITLVHRYNDGQLEEFPVEFPKKEPVHLKIWRFSSLLKSHMAVCQNPGTPGEHQNS